MRKIIIVVLMSFLLAGCGKTEVTMELNPGVDTIELGGNWVDAGAKALVEEDVFELTSKSTVNTDKLGTYIVEYIYSVDNEDFSIDRTVWVVDQTLPVLTLKAGVDTIEVGDDWVDAGVIVSDNSNETLIAEVTGVVNNLVVGTYEITYTATDSSDNSTSIVRFVDVVSK